MRDNAIKLLTIYLQVKDTLTDDEKRIILRTLELHNISLESDSG